MPQASNHSNILLSEILRTSEKHRLQPTLCDSRIDWSSFLQASGDRLLTPIIARKICTPELSSFIPDDVVGALQMIRDYNLTRNQRLIETFVRIASVLNQGNIRPLPLKGTSLLLYGIYPDQADRIVSDIDILIQPSEVKKALQILKQHDFVQRSNPFLGDKGHWDDRFETIDIDDFRHKPSEQNYHLPPIKEHQDAEFYIEIHTRPCKGHGSMEMELTRLAANSTALDSKNGSLFRRPGLSFTLMHTAHHMLIQDRLMYLGLTDHRHLLDIHHLMGHIVDSGETAELQEMAESTHFNDLSTFALWQCQQTLDVAYQFDFKTSQTGKQWIVNFTAITKNNALQRFRRAWSAINTTITKFFSIKALRHAFGDMPVTKSLPLYTRYQCQRAVHAVTLAVKRKRG
ncbi:nucleotidyltransferase family protein [Granulosicoccus antarcticus]|uniref:Nucleotidyltransferase family protein n=1 Tax=Granulosicoccus antarcticus IMCC3135 TaxID=1192854 RepID=A0A2Z2P227_9GAMM|nr:nucleotidyltransferase family protein [Granulosicoccus antarcticus]ASJ74567.1 hypothetical protein IMCC3135_22485 [Granulosicoccus antarcticus IMCC3135]